MSFRNTVFVTLCAAAMSALTPCTGTAGAAGATDATPDRPWLEIAGDKGPGRDKTIVFISGDEEYRSEEALPQLARILGRRHGFRCVVLFAVDPKDGTVNPNVQDNIPGLDHLDRADLMVIFTRFRNLPDDQMKHVAAYLERGGPVVGLRTATHAFALTSRTYSRYSHNSVEPGWEGGFGRRILGETWISHHGNHGREGTRGVAAPGHKRHPILKGIRPGSIFGPTDVYTVRLPLPGGAVPIVLGQVTETLDPDSPPVAGPKNDPMMPVAWTRMARSESGRTGRIFATTMGSAQDLLYEGTRRMLVNAIYWALGMPSKIPDRSSVDLVGDYRPSSFGFRPNEAWKPGIRPSRM